MQGLRPCTPSGATLRSPPNPEIPARATLPLAPEPQGSRKGIASLAPEPRDSRKGITPRGACRSQSPHIPSARRAAADRPLTFRIYAARDKFSPNSHKNTVPSPHGEGAECPDNLIKYCPVRFRDPVNRCCGKITSGKRIDIVANVYRSVEIVEKARVLRQFALVDELPVFI